MGTRSTIALELDDGRVAQVYCHWDGYLEHNGVVLQDHYADRNKVLQLIELGDISSLGPELGEQHDFDIPYAYGTPEYVAEANRRRNITTFYGRDRGEDSCHATYFNNFEDYVDNHDYQEYEYIFRRDNKWYVSKYKTNYTDLAQLLELEQARKAA